MDDKKQHWENVFSTKGPHEVSWFQAYPKTSIGFLELFNLPLTANIIDIGGGDSNFVDVLLDKGYKNIWVLDIAAAALDKAKNRLGKRADMVHWIVSDVTEFCPPVKFDFWHDRAAFHFLTTEDSINKYVSISRAGISNNGYLIISTFSESGPPKCSGLQVQQYSEASMLARFDLGFSQIKCVTENHITPFDTIQHFVYCSFQRK